MVSEQGLCNPSDIRMYQKLISVSFDNTDFFFFFLPKEKTGYSLFFCRALRNVQQEELWRGGGFLLHPQTGYCYLIFDGKICSIRFHCKRPVLRQYFRKSQNLDGYFKAPKVFHRVSILSRTGTSLQFCGSL